MRPEVGQSPSEVFDVVDAADRVIGRASREEVHQRGLYHRAVHIFWLSPDGQLGLQRRSFAKDSCPGLLSSACAGHVDAGEDYQSAAVRELAEELGIRVAPEELQEIDYVPAHDDLGHEFVRCYVLRRPVEPCRLAPFEVDSVLWRRPEELVAWIGSQRGLFAPRLLHLLGRPAIQRSLGLR